MILLYIILIAIPVGWWLSTSDIAYSFSSVIATRAMGKYFMIAGVLFFFILGGILFAGDLSADIEKHARLTTPVSSVIISISAFLAVLATYKLSRLSSICYGIMGAIFGWKLFMYNSIDYSYLFKLLFLWMIVPVLSLCLSALLYKIYQNFTSHSKIHFFKLSYYLRLGIILVFILFIIAIGSNNGAVLLALTSTVKPNLTFSLDRTPINIEQLLLSFSFISIFLTTYWKTIRSANDLAHGNSDINTESTLFMILSATLLSFYFSFPVCSNFIGLEVSPLSFSQITFSSLVGINLVKKQDKINYNKISKIFISNLLTPALAFVLAYFIFSIISRQSITFNGTNIISPNPADIINITIPFILIISALSIAIILLYFRKQNKIRAKAQREALIHQEDLFQNQKSLSDLEVKTVLLENESLNTKLELKRKELINVALNISEQKVFLEEIYNEIKNIKDFPLQEDKNKKIEDIEKQLLQKMNFSQEIESFYAQIEKLHKDFNLRLVEQYPNLTENEKRLIILLRLGFSTKHIASLLNISPKSVEIARYRLRNKLGLTREHKLISYLKSI